MFFSSLRSCLCKITRHVGKRSGPFFAASGGMGSLAGSGTVQRRLVVLDFDETIVDVDTYTSVIQMAPQHGLQLPAELRSPPSREGWPSYMQAILQFLHTNGIGAAEIRRVLEALPMTKGMPELLQFLWQKQTSLYDTVILSDANACFIEWILQRHGLANCFVKIFTNPAEVDAKDGSVKLGVFHHQTDCSLSPRNMCKGKVLQEWMATRLSQTGLPYSHVYYVGDGENDLCPGQRLTANDIFFVRKDFPLAKKLLASSVQCQVELWSDAYQVLQRLRDMEVVT